MKPGAAIALIVLMVAGALALRLPELERRPMHTDEAVHAIKFLGLWERGEYRYDPHEYHGPFLYYATLPWVWISGARDAATLREGTLRLVSVCFGVALVGLAFLARPALGWMGATWVALFTAASPAMVFYSRYYIHELCLVFWSSVFLVTLWWFGRTRNGLWLLAAGVALGCMHATKETFVFVVASAAAGAALASGWTRWREGAWPGSRWPRRWCVAALLVALGVSVLFFTSLGQNWQGPVDSVRTYLAWLERAQGRSPHVHPWYYYLRLMVGSRPGGGTWWSEGFIVILGLVGIAGALWGRRLREVDTYWARWIAFYTLLMTAIYSAIPYKTPWCELGFLHGWILMAGAGVVRVWGWCRSPLPRALVGLVLVVGTSHLGWQAYRASYPLADSQRNPFVYAHTLGSVLELVEKVRQVADAAPTGKATVVKVMARGGDYWPLPWYLRDFTYQGYYDSVPGSADAAAAPILIASPEFARDIEALLGERQQALGYFGLRPRVFLQLFVERELWDAYLRLATSRPTGAGRD